MLKMSQKEKRQEIDIGASMNQVSPVSYWYKQGHFKNDEEAQGAFTLAYQQGLDGMGKSIEEWMGLSSKEFNAWMRNRELPRKSRNG